MKNLKDEIEEILADYEIMRTLTLQGIEQTYKGGVVEELVQALTSLIEQEKERVRKETREQAVREFVKVCHKSEIYGDTGIVTGNFIDSGNSDLECLAEQYLAERNEQE